MLSLFRIAAGEESLYTFDAGRPIQVKPFELEDEGLELELHMFSVSCKKL